MKTIARFYHAGCPVCVSAEEGLLAALDPTRFQVEKVHLGERAERIAEAKRLGVVSVPALVIGRAVFHVNHGADLAALERAAP